MRITTPTDAVRALVAMREDMMIASLYMKAALQQLDQGMPGFPSGLDGAGASDGLNNVERLATTPDEARILQHQVFTLVGRGYDDLRDLAVLLKRLGVTPSRPTVEKDVTPDAWCVNHYRLVHTHEPTRRLGGTYCRFCEDFKNAHGNTLPNRALLEVQGRKSRVTDADIVRTMPGVKETAA